MSDFILPGDIEAMAQQVSANIADAWSNLQLACYTSGTAVSLAEVAVVARVAKGMSEIEAIQETFKDVVMGKL